MVARHSVVLMLFLVLSMIATACTGQPGTPAASALSLYGDLERLDPGGEIITVWYPAAYEDVLLRMLDRFNAENRWGIAVRGVRADDVAQLYARMQSAAAMGRLPDLVILSPGYLAVSAADGLAVELTPYLKSPRWGFSAAEQGEFYPFARQAGQLVRPSGRYGFPFAFSAGLLVYNRGWLQQLGYDHPPRTWDEFREMACAVSIPEEGVYGYEFPVDDHTFIRMLIGRGGRLMNEEETEYTFGDDKGLEALTFLRVLLAEGCAVREARWEQAEADFAAGRVLFVMSNNLHIPHYRQIAAQRGGLDWAVAPLPTSTGVPVTDFFGVYWSIPPTTPQRQLAAWLVIRWMNGPDQQARWVSLSDYLPHRRLPEKFQAARVEETPQYADVLALLDLGAVTEPEVAGYEKCRDAVQMMVGAAVAGEDPSPHLMQTVGFCNSVLREK